jgi:hypothetical protein
VFDSEDVPVVNRRGAVGRRVLKALYTARSVTDLEFSVTTPTDSKIVVTKTHHWGSGFGKSEAVVFERTDSGIVARNAKEQHFFTAKPSLAMNGDCMLEVDDHRLELWQVSKKALEPLFFP